MYTCSLMGYEDPMNTKAAKERIATAASTLVCYDLGYQKVTGKTRLDIWLTEIEDSKKPWRRHKEKTQGNSWRQLRESNKHNQFNLPYDAISLGLWSFRPYRDISAASHCNKCKGSC
jgi:hypothetical protein